MLRGCSPRGLIERRKVGEVTSTRGAEIWGRTTMVDGGGGPIPAGERPNRGRGRARKMKARWIGPGGALVRETVAGRRGLAGVASGGELCSRGLGACARKEKGDEDEKPLEHANG